MIKLKNILFLIEKGKRANIEDYIFPSLNSAKITDKIFIVCDGVGGENKGEIASKIAAETLGKFLNEVKETITEKHLQLALNQVRQNFKKHIELHIEASKMSTTLTLAVVNNKNVLLAWCGDSKIYHIRGNKILWKSKDHSLVQHLLDIGEINEQEAIIHPQRNIIVRSISANTKESDVDYHLLNNIKENDYILLATDGIFEQINDNSLLNILNHTDENKTELIYKKCEGFTNDNYSMYLLKLSQKPIAKHTKTILFILASLIIVFLFTYLFLFNEKAKNEINVKPKEDINSKNVDIPIFKKIEEIKAKPIEINTIPIVKNKETNDIKVQDKKEKPIISNDLKKEKKQIESKKDSMKLKSDSIKIQ